MKFHIIKNGETLEKIMFLYQVKESEIREVNKHIKNFNKLIPGTKIKIPTITETIDSDILEMEPFIEDYYPKIDEEENKEEKIEEEIRLTEDKDIIENNKNTYKDDSNINSNNNSNNIVMETKEDNKEINKDINNELNKENNENKEVKEDSKEIQKKDNKRHKVCYYPYYYYCPYNGQYYLYYYPYII